MIFTTHPLTTGLEESAHPLGIFYLIISFNESYYKAKTENGKLLHRYFPFSVKNGLSIVAVQSKQPFMKSPVLTPLFVPCLYSSFSAKSFQFSDFRTIRQAILCNFSIVARQKESVAYIGPPQSPAPFLAVSAVNFHNFLELAVFKRVQQIRTVPLHQQDWICQTSKA